MKKRGVLVARAIEPARDALLVSRRALSVVTPRLRSHHGISPRRPSTPRDRRASSPSASSSASSSIRSSSVPTRISPATPRDLPRDRSLAEARGVDCLFVPDVSAMYPAEPLARVIPGPIADTLEGTARPGHFNRRADGREQAVFTSSSPTSPCSAARIFSRGYSSTDGPRPRFRRRDRHRADGARAGRARPGRHATRTSVRTSDARAGVVARPADARANLARRGSGSHKVQRAGLEAMHAPGVIPEYCALVDEDLRPVSRGHRPHRCRGSGARRQDAPPR